MKIKLPRPSPAMVVALVALFAALGGNALGLNHDSSRAQTGHPRFTLRAGHVVDTDTTAHDGVFNRAYGHAQCRRGERLISGGLRLRSGPGSVFPGQNVSMVESGPVPKVRQWFVSFNSDLGGAARQDFVVFAYCRE